VTHVEHHAARPQARQPASQQRRGFHVAGKHPARGTDESLDPEAADKGPQVLRRAGLDERRQHAGGIS
jgi:hypothetical protein